MAGKNTQHKTRTLQDAKDSVLALESEFEALRAKMEKARTDRDDRQTEFDRYAKQRDELQEAAAQQALVLALGGAQSSSAEPLALGAGTLTLPQEFAAVPEIKAELDGLGSGSQKPH